MWKEVESEGWREGTEGERRKGGTEGERRKGGTEGCFLLTHNGSFLMDRIYVPDKTLEHMASHPEVSRVILGGKYMYN